MFVNCSAPRCLLDGRSTKKGMQILIMCAQIAAISKIPLDRFLKPNCFSRTGNVAFSEERDNKSLKVEIYKLGGLEKSDAMDISIPELSL